VDTEPQVEEIQEDITEVLETAETQEQEVDVDQVVESQEEETRVPLSALQKERKKRQDAEARSSRAEIESQFLKEQYAKPTEPAEEDDSLYESVTKKDLNSSNQLTRDQILREVEERMWTNSNAEKREYVDENLKEFLQKRPNLASAINESTNRYAQAYELMSKLSETQQKQVRQVQQRKPSPGSPSSIPKAAAINQAVDVMKMTDDEYRTWRTSKRSRR